VIGQEPGSGYAPDEFGWNYTDNTHPGVLGTVLLVLATSGYWAWLWLLKGLPPVSYVASHFAAATRNRRQSEVS
jgi:hypothetical protein